MIKVNTLGYVVNEVLMDMNIPQSPNFERVLHFAGRGYRDLNVSGIMPSNKTKRLIVNPHTHSCKLPSDYVEYIRIAIVCRSRCGYETLINLVYNDEIALHGNDTRLECNHQQTTQIINGICNHHDNLHGQKINPNWQPGQQQWGSWGNQWDGNGWGDEGQGGGCGCGCNNNSNNNCGCGCNGNPLNHNPEYTTPCANNGGSCNGTQLMPLQPGTLIQQGCGDFGSGWGDSGYGYWGWGAFYNGIYNYSAINFGIGPGFYPGGFRINKELQTIQFDSCFNCHKVIMEYKSSGFDDSGDAFIPEDTIPALNEYIHWKYNENRRGTLPEMYLYRKDAAAHKQQYYGLREDIIHRLNAMTDDDYLDIFRRYCFQQVKV